MKYSQIRRFDVANGKGIRTSLFVSGCTHNCKGCFNKEQQNFEYGNVWNEDVEKTFLEFVGDDNVSGVSILGGEPLQQTMDDNLKKLLEKIRSLYPKKNIWIWSGYRFEECLKDKKRKELISLCDVLVDGRYEEDKRNLSLKYRGSENQRVIDVRKSLEENKVVLYE